MRSMETIEVNDAFSKNVDDLFQSVVRILRLKVINISPLEN